MSMRRVGSCKVHYPESPHLRDTAMRHTGQSSFVSAVRSPGISWQRTN